MENASKLEQKKKKPVYYRVITSVIFFASFSMCVYQIYELILLYLSDPIETQIKMIMHDSMKFPAVTVCNLNPVQRSRWQKKMNKNNSDMPDSSAWKEKPTHAEKLRRSARSAKSKPKREYFNNEIEKDALSSALKRTRTKRQSGNFFFGDVRKNVAIIYERLDEITETLNTHLNATVYLFSPQKAASNTSLNVSIATCNTECGFNASSIWANLTETRERQVELETWLDEQEKRLQVAELTTAEIAEEMARTRSYLDHLKANISQSVEETETSNDTKVVITEDGLEELPASEDLKAFQNYLKDIGELTRHDFQELGNQKEDFIASCSWQGTICDSSHFEVFQNFMYGNCFTFNTSKVGSHVSGTGPYNGLSLSLFIEQDAYMDRIASAAGARVVIHESHFNPLPDEEGFSVAAGYTTAISLKKLTTETVKPICDPDVETSAVDGKKFIYSQKGCLKKCLSDEIIHQCHCAGIQFLIDMKTCSLQNQAEVECVERLERLARENQLPCYCPLPCRTTVYDPIISSAIWPAEKYFPALLEELVRVRHKVLDVFDNITDFSQYFRKNFLRINIFFQELKEQEMVERRSYGIARLLSDIGGQLGLWVGVSVLTLVDFTETVSSLFKMLCRRIREKFVRKSRRLSIAIPRPNFDSPYAVDVKGSFILSPNASMSRATPEETTTPNPSSISTNLPHVHFEKPP